MCTSPSARSLNPVKTQEEGPSFKFKNIRYHKAGIGNEPATLLISRLIPGSIPSLSTLHANHRRSEKIGSLVTRQLVSFSGAVSLANYM